MPKYSRKISTPGLGAQQIYDRVSSELDQAVGKLPVGKCQINRDPDRKAFSLKASMFTATLKCEDGSVQLDAELGLLAAPFRGKIDGWIDGWLAKNLKSSTKT